MPQRQLFEVEGFGEQGVALKDIEIKVQRVLPLCFVRDSMRLGFAFTSYSAQGRGLGNEASESEPERGLTVHTGHAIFNLKHLFTGTSRCRSGRLLQVA